MTTKEVEERLGITRQTLIYYENEGFISPQRNQNNYRNYDEQDIIRLQTVMELRNMKISIDDIKRIFRGDISIKDILDEKQQDLLSSNNGQNPGDADKMGISRVDLCPLALKWL